MRNKLYLMLLAYVSSAMAVSSIQSNPPTSVLLNQINISYANKKAIYREIYTIGLEKIVDQIYQQKLAANTWGVIFDLDGTLLDDSQQHYANPGSVEISCKIIKLGGMVSIVTDRSGSIQNNTEFINETKNELDRNGICYSNVLFANNNNDSNKNPRFVAVSSGDYDNVIATKRLPPLKILAYFGNSIEDFPGLKQNLANSLPVSDSMFSEFGQKYFMLPR